MKSTCSRAWEGREDTLAVTILVMVKNNQAYIGDGWARLGNSLKEEKAYIATKSVFHPQTVTLADVRYAVFNEGTKVEVDDDDTCPFEGQDDFVPIKKVKYEYLTPRELPCGNLPSDVVWVSENDNAYYLVHCRRTFKTCQGPATSARGRQAPAELSWHTAIATRLAAQ